MAKIIPPQDIPSELLDKFSAIGGVARPNNVAQKRYPWSIWQPGTIDQVRVWDIFKTGCECFVGQTQAQREWWFEQAKPSGLWYFNYFMKETLILLHQGIFPYWCPAVFEEHFPGTELDLTKWVEPFTTLLPLPWYVNNAFNVGQIGGVPGKLANIQTRTQVAVTPLYSHSIEFKLFIALTGPDTYNDAAHVSLRQSESRIYVYHDEASFRVHNPLPPPTYWSFPVDQGVLHSVKVEFPKTFDWTPWTPMKVYLNDELVITGQSEWPWGNHIHLLSQWWTPSGQNTLVTQTDEIIVRKI